MDTEPEPEGWWLWLGIFFLVLLIVFLVYVNICLYYIIDSLSLFPFGRLKNWIKGKTQPVNKLFFKTLAGIRNGFIQAGHKIMNAFMAMGHIFKGKETVTG